MNKAFLLFSVYCLAFSLTETQGKQDPFKHPFANPVDQPDLPRVLILGDSISIGYTPRVRRLLDGRANVHRPALNCRWSAFVDENLNPYTGDWIARTRLHEWAETRPDFEKLKGGKNRGKDYNHSSYNDLIITGLVGLRPRADDVVEVNPLLPADTWDWFCLDNLLYNGRILTIIWDKTGEKYGKGKGLVVLADGKQIARSETIRKIRGVLK